MSWQAQTYVERLTVRSAQQKLILVYLSKHINEEGYCWPSQATLARSSSISERQVREHLKNMENGGLIVRTRRNNAAGNRTSDLYEIVGFREWLARMNSIDVSAADAAADRAYIAENPKEKPTGRKPPVGLKRGNQRAPIGGFPEGSLPAGSRQLPTGVKTPGNLKSESLEELESRCDTPAPSASLKTGQKKGSKRQGGLDFEGEVQGQEERKAREHSDAIRAQYDAYCELAAEIGLEPPTMLMAGRRRGIERLNEQFGRAAWDEALEMLRRSPVLVKGSPNRRPLRFDEFLYLDNFVKVREGRYTDVKPGAGSASTAAAGALDVNVKPREWRVRMKLWAESGGSKWVRKWGPPPGADGCFVPADLLAEFKSSDAA